MTMTDPIADMLTRIRNANVAMHDDVTMPSSKLKEALAETSRSNGWLILVYHQVAAPDASGTVKNTIAADRSTINSDVLATQLQLIDESGIQVQPVAQAFEQLQGP